MWCHQWHIAIALQWRHNRCHGISNHQPHAYLLNRLFRRRSKKTSKLRVTGLCAGNSTVTGEFPHKGPVTRTMFPFDDVIMGHVGRNTSPLWEKCTGHQKITTQKTRKGPMMRSFDDFFLVNLCNLLNKQRNCRWFKTLQPFLQHHLNVSYDAPPLLWTSDFIPRNHIYI